MKRHSVSRDWLPSLSLFVMGAAVVAIVVVRILAAPVPLERDEGEYALMGQLILDGTPPYSEAANMKLPGIYYAYSVILTLFGQTITGIHLGTMVVNLLSTFILYLLARPVIGQAGAALAGAAFIIMSVDISVLGLFAHASQFVVLFALAGFWLLLKSSGSRQKTALLWSSGLCLGLAVLMKQSGVFFAMAGLLWFLREEVRLRPIAWKHFLAAFASLAGGIVVPYLVVLVVMSYQGVFGRFWFWTVDYARTYVSEVGPKMGFDLFLSGLIPIIKNNPVIWSMTLIGIIGVWFTEAGRQVAPFLLVFFLFSFLSVCPGFYFRQHYFVQLLPAAALYSGAAVLTIAKASARYMTKSGVMLFVVIVVVTAYSLIGVLSMGRALVASTPEQFSRSVYGGNPFPESVKVAEYIKENAKPEDRIAVFGSEPQIYFYAHRKPAAEHIYMYGLMEPQPYALHMQEEMIAQVEKSAPSYMVLVKVPMSWLQRPESEKKLFSWIGGYIDNYYQPVLIADIYADRTIWIKGKDAASFIPRRDSYSVIVFGRKKAR